MSELYKTLLKSYFKTHSFVKPDLESFNKFIEEELQQIVIEEGEIEPQIIPQNVESFKIVFDKIRTDKPKIVEADGSVRKILPTEARLRKITYAAPMYITVKVFINGVQREEFETQIGNMPIMLRSEKCHLNNMSRRELIDAGEDPDDPGSYFIINGTEKALVKIEDLAANSITVEEATTGVSRFVAKIFSESGSYKTLHTVERLKDGLFYLSFTRVKRVPLIAVVKALGLIKDELIMRTVSKEKQYDELIINLLEMADLKKTEDAADTIAKSAGITQNREIRVERMFEMLDRYLLPHLGTTEEARAAKAQLLCKMMRKHILVSRGTQQINDKDHYSNKRLKLSGDLMADLFRVNLRLLISDMIYNFQRAVKRGKIPTIKVIIRQKLLTSRMYSSMATGNWPGGRKGISQRSQRLNFLDLLSHLQRVVSPLSSAQENFKPRELHCTHIGRLCPIETPEGTNIGLKKNLALLASTSLGADREEVNEQLRTLGVQEEETGMTDVYNSGFFLGTVESPEEFTAKVRQARREGKLSKEVNIYHNKHTNEIKIESGKGRLRRPLLRVNEGKSVLTKEHADDLKAEKTTWEELVAEGVIEYLDAAEEEETYVAFYAKDLTPEHTHLEITPMAMFGLITTLVPYANFNSAQKVNTGSKNQKQALGFYAANYHVRADMDINLLYSPQYPIVKSLMHEITEYERHPSGQNVVVAVMSYNGYNMEDAIVINKGSIERGLARSTYFKPMSSEELRYSGGLVDSICVPDKEVEGYRDERDYRLLEEDGIIHLEAKVEENNVVIGKASPPRFLNSGDRYGLIDETMRESSVAMKHDEHGTVDMVFLSENSEGNRLVQVKIRDEKIPEIGDKFSSRQGQKGVLGLVVPHADMPFSASGIVPDLLFSPHGLPTRMTMAQLIELVAGKTGALNGRFVDGTVFDSESQEEIRKELKGLGFRENGCETLYDGVTGEQLKVRIYIGNMYYMRLKHMVSNKLQVRARGPIQLLTKQPTEGRAKEGGLRLGEMEKDTFVGHGSALLIKERFDPDKTKFPICQACGLIAIYDEFNRKAYCNICGEDSEVHFVEMAYGFKLLLDELKSLCIYPQLTLEDKY